MPLPLALVGAWPAVKRVLAAIPLWVWLAIGAAVGVFAYGEWKEGEGTRREHAKFVAYQAKLIAATALAVQAARAKEAHDRELFAEIGADYLEAKDEARGKELAVADAVRNERLRLRRQWRCPAAGVPGAAGSSQTPDADAELRAAAAGRIVRVGAEADAQVRGLQALLDAERARPIAR